MASLRDKEKKKGKIVWSLSLSQTKSQRCWKRLLMFWTTDHWFWCKISFGWRREPLDPPNDFPVNLTGFKRILEKSIKKFCLLRLWNGNEENILKCNVTNLKPLTLTEKILTNFQHFNTFEQWWAVFPLIKNSILLNWTESIMIKRLLIRLKNNEITWFTYLCFNYLLLENQICVIDRIKLKLIPEKGNLCNK